MLTSGFTDLDSRRGERRALRPETWIPALYVAGAALWIAFSDIAVEGLSRAPADFARWSTLKGWCFVAVTGLALRAVLRRAFASVRESARRVRDSEQRHRQLVETSPDGILIQRNDRIAFANGSAARLFGAASPSDLVGRSVFELIDPAEHASARDRGTRVEGSLPFEAVVVRRLRRLDGTLFRGEVGLSRIELEGIPAMQVAIRDVSRQWELQAELSAEREFLRAILDNAGVLVGVLDRSGRMVRLNRHFERVTGYPVEELEGRLLWESIPADEAGRVAADLDEVWKSQVPAVTTNHFVTRDGVRRLVEWTNTVVRSAAGEPFLVKIGQDITERHLIESALHESEERYRLLVNTSPYAIVVQQDEWVVFANPAAARLVGARDPEDLVGRVVLDLVPPEHRASTEQRIRRMLAGEPEKQPRIETLLRLDGHAVPVEVSALPFVHQGRPAIQVMAVDVTERRRAEDRLRESREQLRALAARLQTIREEEKARIARDLHDELGQLLTGLKMDLRGVERRIGGLEPSEAVNAVLDRVVAASALADQTVATVQRIAADLRPGALDRLGLGPALGQEARRFQERTGIACDTRLSETLPPIPPETATALYRICQEAMTNVARHSGAARVVLCLDAEPEAIALRVEDDGRGLDATAVESPLALGLLGMAERATMVGGEVRFERGDSGGTIVTARIPIGRAPGRAGGSP